MYVINLATGTMFFIDWRTISLLNCTQTCAANVVILFLQTTNMLNTI